VMFDRVDSYLVQTRTLTSATSRKRKRRRLQERISEKDCSYWIGDNDVMLTL
ncbi:Hypothetical predicted protein, partial [Pelobates cultripes]